MACSCRVVRSRQKAYRPSEVNPGVRKRPCPSGSARMQAGGQASRSEQLPRLSQRLPVLSSLVAGILEVTVRLSHGDLIVRSLCVSAPGSSAVLTFHVAHHSPVPRPARARTSGPLRGKIFGALLAPESFFFQRTGGWNYWKKSPPPNDKLAGMDC